MGFFDSSSESYSSTTNLTTVDEQNFSLQDTSAPSVFNTGEAAATTVNITDQGVIEDAFNAFNESIDDATDYATTLAGSVIDFGGRLLDFSAGVIGTVTQEQADFSKESLDVAAAATRSDASEISTTLIKSLAIAGAVVAVSFAAVKFGKGK